MEIHDSRPVDYRWHIMMMIVDGIKRSGKVEQIKAVTLPLSIEDRISLWVLRRAVSVE